VPTSKHILTTLGLVGASPDLAFHWIRAMKVMFL